MASFSVIYASTEGHTRAIADHVADRLRQAGHAAEVRQASETGTLPDTDAFVVAGSLHLGKHQPEIASFVTANRDGLSARPSLFLSVSLSAAGGAEDLANAQRCVDDFIAETGWQPTRTALVAGGVHLKKINWFKRLAIRRILRQKGVEVDETGDRDLTDWENLNWTVDGFVDLVAGG